MQWFGKNWLVGLQQLVCLRIIQALSPMKKVLQAFLCGSVNFGAGSLILEHKFYKKPSRGGFFVKES